MSSRAENTCELCAVSDDGLTTNDVGPDADGTPATQVFLCATCSDQITGEIDPNHWKPLANTMWSEHPPVQIMAWRMLDKLSDHDWARDLTDMLYLDDETLAWAKSGRNLPKVIHRDSNGAQLAAGDTVMLIKDLPVKGAGFTAKRGTAVRGISLVADNAGHIEGKVDGQRIVILTEFVKKR